MRAPISVTEPQRLAELHALNILDSKPEPQLQSIAQIAATVLDMPVALISLVDAERQWFKAKVGLDVSEIGRDHGFCAYAILQREVFIVEDAREDARFAANPLVTSGPEFRFYAGAPLMTSKGHNIGTLCVFDTKPRSLTGEQQSILHMLAGLAVQTIETAEGFAAAELRAKWLAASSGAREPVLSSFGHELRTLLNHIMGFAEMVKRNLANATSGGAERSNQYLDIVLESGTQLSDVIDHVIRLEQAAYKGNLRCTAVDLNDLLGQVVRSFAGVVAAKAQKLVFLPDERDIVVHADKTSVRQIAINLISNACKYSPEATVIEVSTCLEENGGWGHVAIADQGPGIPEEIVSNLDKPFLRGSNYHSATEEGLGLGLNISKRLCETMRGSMTLKHELSGGTRASLWLPLAGVGRGSLLGAVPA